MHAPAGSPRLPVWFPATALVLLVAPELAGTETREEIRQAIHAGLPRYDPTAHEKAQAEQAARSAPKHAPAPLPEEPPPKASVPAGEKIFELPALTVQADPDLPKPLPRVDPPPKPLKDLQPEPWESGSGRDARLIRKHLTTFQQFLLGRTAVAAARAAEYREQRARQMNELAAAIELQAILGALSPAEIKRLRAEYEKLYNSGPK